MNKRVTRKRISVLLLTVVMIMSCLSMGDMWNTSGIINAQELATATDAEVEDENVEFENTYSSENFDVVFRLDSVWDTGYNATITIYNTSDNI